MRRDESEVNTFKLENCNHTKENLFLCKKERKYFFLYAAFLCAKGKIFFYAEEL